MSLGEGRIRGAGLEPVPILPPESSSMQVPTCSSPKTIALTFVSGCEIQRERRSNSPQPPKANNTKVPGSGTEPELATRLAAAPKLVCQSCKSVVL